MTVSTHFSIGSLRSMSPLMLITSSTATLQKELGFTITAGTLPKNTRMSGVTRPHHQNAGTGVMCPLVSSPWVNSLDFRSIIFLFLILFLNFNDVQCYQNSSASAGLASNNIGRIKELGLNHGPALEPRFLLARQFNLKFELCLQ